MSTADTLKRFDRIVAIFIQLQSRRVIRAEDLADRFQVSLRTIYRDIRTLETSGIPIIGEAGVGYSIMDGYRLPPIQFTREEAVSFIAAEKLMETFLDKNLGNSHQSAMCKIKSVLKGTDKDWINRIDGHVHIDASQSPFNKAIPDALEVLLGSIAEKKQVSLSYRSSADDDLSERLIEPVGVFHENHFWYVIGYCHLRKDYRQFRSDRIQGIGRTILPFTKTHPPIAELRKPKDEKPKEQVIIRFKKKTVKYIRHDLKHFGFECEVEKDGMIEITFFTAETDTYMPRWLLCFADSIKIVKPERLKDSLKVLLDQIKANLE